MTVARPTPRPRLRRYPGIDRVTAEIARLIDRERSTPAIRRLALRLVKEGGIPLTKAGIHPDMRDRRAVAAAMYLAVITRVTYTPDPERVEFVQPPRATLDRAMGDCEDMVVLGGALLSSVGVPVRVKIVGYGDRGYDHTYLEVDAGRGWEAWDATLETRFGDRAPGETRDKVIRVVKGGTFGLGAAPKPKLYGQESMTLAPSTPVLREPDERLPTPRPVPSIKDRFGGSTTMPLPIRQPILVSKSPFIPGRGIKPILDPRPRPRPAPAPTPMPTTDPTGPPSTPPATPPGDPAPAEAGPDETAQGAIPMPVLIGGAAVLAVLLLGGGLSPQEGTLVETSTRTTKLGKSQ